MLFFVIRRSFEQNIDFSRKDYTSYLDPPKGLTYKPNTRHHLDLYNTVGGQDDDSTMPAENPFSSTDSSLNQQHNSQMLDDSLYAHHSVPNVDFPTDSNGHVQIPPPQLYARPPHNTVSTVSTGSVSDSITPPNNNIQPHSQHFGYERRIPEQYGDDSIARYKEQNYPQDHITGDISPRSSMDGDDPYNYDMTSFKGGSTTRLVTAPSKPKSATSSNKGSGNISFVDTVDVSPPQSIYSSMTSQVTNIYYIQ